ncbi:uncharacterized protein EI90DRAFT_823622 [Cantharellus anzutake]|uniref:uncharacterized protein n=1 Tax=Cantharellus anzutake TaxID=1750568 RepID=UPI001905EF8C|nr:uncharacterized protein EI90DRAFT_823622 [Cantharellus anzutake]KAF8343046.1 hypothetical protein EI90DRAFT_823622 [Cantharellus anzutake]
MPPKRRNLEEGGPSQPWSTRCSRVSRSDDATSAVKAEAKSDPRPPKIQWDFNERWTDRLIEYLSNNPDVRLKMFSDSVKDARKESRKKVVGSKLKVEYYRQIARAVFDIVDEAERTAYVSDPERYATSVMGRIIYLQKTYTGYRKSLKVTGGGLKDDDDDGSEAYNNQLEMIRSSFRWWDVLHAWWSEHPKYAFQMVTNSTTGIEKMTRSLGMT